MKLLKIKFYSLIKDLLLKNIFFYEKFRLDRDDGRDDEPDALSRPKEQTSNDELHFGENWFHGKLSGGREEAEK